MTVVADKYRGTKEYHLVYSELITATRYSGTVTYQEIAQLMGLPLSGNHMGKEVGHILGEISEDECKQGRQMLSAVAVGVSGEPGDGFYTLAGQLYKLDEGVTAEQKKDFWKNEKAKLYKTWQKNIHAPK